MKWINLLLLLIVFTKIESDRRVNETRKETARRILNGESVLAPRHYMVYLRPVKQNPAHKTWLCGGVIIDEHHILTSAACIEDMPLFHVVAGTHVWVPPDNDKNECVNNAKKAVWKCVPKDYDFVNNALSGVRWTANDIAVVRIENEFNFKKRIRGCDFIPRKINFNNRSENLEAPDTVASIAGWGSIRFTSPDGREENSPELLETEVKILPKKDCKEKWEEPYHYIIDNYMICTYGTKDHLPDCGDGVDCTHILDTPDHASDSNHTPPSFDYAEDTRRANYGPGGFCENDHGGPLVVGHGEKAVVIGVMSAYRAVNGECDGPFLYTSVWKAKDLIHCALGNKMDTRCRKVMKAHRAHLSETTYDWSQHSTRSDKKFESAWKKRAETMKPLVRFRSSNDSSSENSTINDE